MNKIAGVNAYLKGYVQKRFGIKWRDKNVKFI